MASDAPPTPCQSSKPIRLTIPQLQEDRLPWYKLHVFMYDLRNFRSKDTSRDRLESVIDERYIGEPYFTAEESEKLRRTIVHGSEKALDEVLTKFFETKLEKRIQGRVKETGDWKVCAAHDLAPIIERAFRVNSKDLSKNKGFLRLVQSDGLQLQDEFVWKSLGKR